MVSVAATGKIRKMKNNDKKMIFVPLLLPPLYNSALTL
jgi:hypothetical protein